MSENLVLGLLGGLIVDAGIVKYDRTELLKAKGPVGLGLVPKQGRAYIGLANLYKAQDANGSIYSDDAGAADDSQIPEFLDLFGSPMPILYLRAIPGRKPGLPHNNTKNRVITEGYGTGTHGTPDEGPYDLCQIQSYTTSSIGVGKALEQKFEGNADDPKPTKGQVINHGIRSVEFPLRSLVPAPLNYYVPYDALTYFRNPNVGVPTDSSTWEPRQKDGYILISAGRDRVYGTPDDITSFGDVVP
jgi:hypothetical protein